MKGKYVATHSSNIYNELFQQLTPNANNVLWIADENVSEQDLALFNQYPSSTLVTNRYTLFQQARKILCAENVSIEFSDFDFTAFSAGSFQQILYRVSKERPATHWVLNNCSRLLQENGRLHLAGAKDEGIKTYTDKTVKQLGFTGLCKKKGKHYTALLTRSSGTTNTKLEHKDYTKLRTIGEAFNFKLQSKPGVYGWNKIDEGSELLAQQFLHRYNAIEPGENALDLGCGYGYLSLALAAAGIRNIVATDNNAAAVATTKANLEAATLVAQPGQPSQYHAIAADCGDSISEPFNWILCNPPFHQGYAVESDLTERFVKSARRLLKPTGRALFVVNAFIPIEKVGARAFPVQHTLANNKRFKVVEFCLQ